MAVINRLFKRDYEAVDTFDVGMVLNGPEVKSVRLGNIRLESAFGKIINGEIYLINSEIPLYRFAKVENYEPARKRKLLLNKKEILKIFTKLNTGGRLTLIPVACYNKGRRIKLSLAVARGRGEIAKKKLERLEDIKREEKKDMKEFMKS
ncbi:SsrA-binding protein [Candidatus Roizmanbacteria bacterium CG11_big_fil_rev_8_21_14_0_20_36_8]|uniref:SsrA-binding protein n=2 Tax=Candidatus Roizmaniibacteriota TaxID=1752723 RepID=A0A2M6ITS3_9BACT|nr:MAG: SsrA-binding protein [Candidatus Roizmanbacteria bacterium CG11_big_fil_rev_8_21_14_0_20_36_8]PIZ64933.1 MAG: SsrA-binding protein [Candidatus Roizmanbacteria bacterium CG_4_10_14_0_2_um_filter_36_9]